VFAAFSVYIWQRDGANTESWPWWGFPTLLAFSIGGISLMLFGLLDPSSKMQQWAEASSRHEASLIVMLFAYPVYLLLAPIYDRR
jgi:hypothetical protein